MQSPVAPGGGVGALIPVAVVGGVGGAGTEGGAGMLERGIGDGVTDGVEGVGEVEVGSAEIPTTNIWKASSQLVEIAS